MALEKLYYVYGLDTSCFYTDEEYVLEKRIIKARCYKKKIKDIKESRYSPKFLKEKLKNKEITKEEYKKLKVEWCEKAYSRELKRSIFLNFNINDYINNRKNELKELLAEKLNENTPRSVRADKILNKKGEPSIKRRVSVFESNLTRCLGMEERKFNEQMLIVKIYFFDVAKDILKNGFILNGHKYVFFSASAGQIRTKKFVAVREDLLKSSWNTLTAGLTVERINECGGINVNKYLAYLALCNSGTDVWKNFDIDRCIVVDDFETNVKGIVDYIDDKTFQIERVEKELPIAHMDGCGIMLPSVSKVNFMVRPPWIKGLLAVYDFRQFIIDNNASPIVKDIYGDEHDVIKENIQIIFTKSQFKMYKFYKDWNEYKDNFKKYNCTAGICNKEEKYFADAVINYQMIQTLHDLTDVELKVLAQENVKDICNITTDKSTMLKTFGIDDNKPEYLLSDFQKCLKIYPELLQDRYCRNILKDLKNKLERDLWSARFKIKGKYTFVVPDLYAFCEWLFLKIKNPVGKLKNGEVCCRLFNDGSELDCLRSPHLYCEHPVRHNTYIEGFTTNAIYTSCHDYISRVLQFDNDGDTLLVTDNKTLIEAAKRNMKDKVPLYYEMKKANAQLINSDNLWNGLSLAYTGGNIGEISNTITKIWNYSDNNMDEDKLKCIKVLCALTNFTIDYAKTLYKPTLPSELKNQIQEYDRSKVPQFFLYAKNKEKRQVEKSTDSPINRLRDLFKKKNLKFNFTDDNIGNFDFTVLMNNPKIEYDKSIGNYFKEYVSNNMNFNQKIDKQFDDRSMSNYQAVYDMAKEEIFKHFPKRSESDIIDNIIMFIFKDKNTYNKKAFWQMYQSEVYENIKKNIAADMAICQKCHNRFKKTHGMQKYCSSCRDYKKQDMKIVTCIDCGTKFEVTKNNKRTIRCDECQHKINNENKNKYREKIRRANF